LRKIYKNKLNIKQWKRFTVIEAKRIMKIFNIPPKGGIPALIKGLKFNFYEKPRTLMSLLFLKER